MPRYQFNKPTRLSLYGELLAAGLPPTVQVETDDNPLTGTPGTACWVTCDDTQYDTVARVVAAHNAALADAAAAQAVTDDGNDRTAAWAAYQNLSSERDLLAGVAPVAAADVRRILLLLVRVQMAILRYLHRRGL